MKCIVINSADRTVTEAEFRGVADLQRMAGGYIEPVPVRLPAGDTLYVDGEGLLKPQLHHFGFDGYPQPLAGTGVVVGAEVDDDSPAGWHNLDPASTVAQVAERVRWLTLDQVRAWSRANASDPMVTVTSIGRDGRTSTEVLQTTGEVFGTAPGKKKP